MKQKFSAQAVGLLIATTLSITSFGQYNESVTSINRDKILDAAKTMLAAEASDAVALKNLKSSNEKVFNDFSKFYHNAADIRVYSTDKHTTITCKIDGASTRVNYNAKGRWLHTIKTYSPDLLPFDVKQLVINAYPSYRMFGVTEVNVGNRTAHLVSIENDKSWKRIKVVNGDSEVYEAYNK